MVKSFKFIVKTNVFEGLSGRVRERKRYRTNINTYTKIHPQIYDKSMQKLCWTNMMQQKQKVIKSVAEKEANNHRKSIRKREAKNEKNKV